MTQLEMPVLLAGGEHDGIAPPANMAAMHGRIAGSELEMFAGGHLFLIQDKSAYPFVIQWLKRQIAKKLGVGRNSYAEYRTNPGEI